MLTLHSEPLKESIRKSYGHMRSAWKVTPQTGIVEYIFLVFSCLLSHLVTVDFSLILQSVPRVVPEIRLIRAELIGNQAVTLLLCVGCPIHR